MRKRFTQEYHPITNASIDGTSEIPHDRACLRAIQSKYKVNATGSVSRTLFVGRLSYKTTEETLRHHFGKFGTIVELRIVKNIVTKESKGYGFVEYKHSRDFEDAYKHMHHEMIDNSRILVDYERSRGMKGWKPRRLGGGLGGKKQSGQMRFGGRDCPFRRVSYTSKG